MTTVIERKTIEEYLSQVQEFKRTQQTNQIIPLINEQIELNQGKKEVEAFFKAEQAFHTGRYERALVLYMQARTLDLFEFFCYRATAFVSFSRGDRDKAVSFLEKALSLRSDLFAEELRQEILERRKNPSENKETGTERELAKKIEKHQEERLNSLQRYLEITPGQETLSDQMLWIFDGCEAPAKPLFFPQSDAASQGGIYFQWNGKGIVINPGSHFLERFHAQERHLFQIHFVIVTQNSPRIFEEVERIYELNSQLNEMSPALHVIHYYLNLNAYQELAHKLKPHFKQERGAVHSLELFVDSSGLEKETLAEGIVFNYFAPGAKAKYRAARSLPLRFDLSSGSRTLRLGYVSGSAWDPALATSLGPLDFLIAGLGSTNPSDYDKLAYNEDSLGYFGLSTLLKETRPRLLLITDFGSKEGDIRLEVTRKMRKEQTQENPTAILPADLGMVVDLRTAMIKCSHSEELLDPLSLQVMNGQEPFGRLTYLSPSSFL